VPSALAQKRLRAAVFEGNAQHHPLPETGTRCVAGVTISELGAQRMEGLSEAFKGSERKKVVRPVAV